MFGIVPCIRLGVDLSGVATSSQGHPWHQVSTGSLHAEVHTCICLFCPHAEPTLCSWCTFGRSPSGASSAVIRLFHRLDSNLWAGTASKLCDFLAFAPFPVSEGAWKPECLGRWALAHCCSSGRCDAGGLGPGTGMSNFPPHFFPVWLRMMSPTGTPATRREHSTGRTMLVTSSRSGCHRVSPPSPL